MNILKISVKTKIELLYLQKVILSLVKTVSYGFYVSETFVC